MYASGSTDNSDESADGGSTESSEESDSGSTENDDMSDTGSMDDDDMSDTGSMDDDEALDWYMKSHHALDSGPIVINDASDSGFMENNDGLSPLPSGPTGTNAALRVESNSTGNSTYPVYCVTCNNDIYSGVLVLRNE